MKLSNERLEPTLPRIAGPDVLHVGRVGEGGEGELGDTWPGLPSLLLTEAPGQGTLAGKLRFVIPRGRGYRSPARPGISPWGEMDTPMIRSLSSLRASLGRFAFPPVSRLLRSLGYQMTPLPDLDPEYLSIIEKARPYTMTPPERVCAVVDAVSYIIRHGIPGGIVECGVWRGGSMMAAALSLLKQNCGDRDLYLFDTFEGMPEPTGQDIDFRGRPARAHFERSRKGVYGSGWCRATHEDVRLNMSSTGYDTKRIHYIEGKVEDTIPLRAPESTALLRLDTDWYESTRHELQHLYPRVSRRGVIIIDDYGHWRGAKRATDEFLAGNAVTMFLVRIDFSCRVGVKAE